MNVYSYLRHERPKELVYFVVVWSVVLFLFYFIGYTHPIFPAVVIPLLIASIACVVSGIDDYRQGKKTEVQTAKVCLEQQQRKIDTEQDYLRWCDEAEGEDRVLQAAVDGLLTLHNWDGMPRIKARLNPDMESLDNRSAHYRSAGFEWRERGSQIIEYKPSHYIQHSEREILGILKHELVHAWIDWKGLEDGEHGPMFQRKMNEVGY